MVTLRMSNFREVRSGLLRIGYIQGDLLLPRLIEDLQAKSFTVDVLPPEKLIYILERQPSAYDVVLFSIAAAWQPTLRLVQQIRNLRYRHETLTRPQALVMSVVSHRPSIELAFESLGSRFIGYTTPRHLIGRLLLVQSELSELDRCAALRLTVMHGGNPGGMACMSGEWVKDVIVRYRRRECRLVESRSGLTFLSLLASHHGIYRNAREIIELMRSCPLYAAPNVTGVHVIARNSVKTYLTRMRKALESCLFDLDAPFGLDNVLSIEERGPKERAYRLNVVTEIEHI